MKKYVFLAILLFGTGMLFVPVQSGFLIVTGDGKTLHFLQSDTKQLVVGWRHSVELTPWEEAYRVIGDGTLKLESTTYQSYGAGTPDMEGQVEVLANGYIRVTGIDRTIPFYSLFYTPVSHYYIKLDGKKYLLSESVPDHENIKIQYKTLFAIEWLYFKVGRI